MFVLCFFFLSSILLLLSVYMLFQAKWNLFPKESMLVTEPLHSLQIWGLFRVTKCFQHGGGPPSHCKDLFLDMSNPAQQGVCKKLKKQLGRLCDNFSYDYNWGSKLHVGYMFVIDRV